MKQIILIVLLWMSCTFIFAQDIIVTKQSEKIEAKITDVEQDFIKYKKFNYQEGPTYTIKKSEIASIIYQNGVVESFMDNVDSGQDKSEHNEKNDVYSVIRNPKLFFQGKCKHIDLYESGSSYYFNSWVGNTYKMNRYHGYFFCNETSILSKEEILYKINNNQVAFITHSQFRDYLMSHDEELYRKYRLGRDLFVSGLVVMSSGYVAGLASMIICLDKKNLTFLPLGIVGAVCFIGGVSMTVSGVVIQNKTVPDLYNKKHVMHSKTAMTWQAGAMGNGMGLSLSF